MNDKLGALEFASTLNGDDTEQVLIVLNRFVKTIRNERTQAFSSEDDPSTASESDSDYLSDSEEEDDDQNRPRKKGKMEKWKLDTKSYNVPFVGTSTHKGSTGVVQIGCWPTGFLEAYLVQSPQAMEILGSDFQRLLTKGNDKMRCAFIQALGELVSSAIPLGKIDDLENMFDLDRAERVSDAANEVYLSFQRIVSIVMKEHQKDVFHVLNEHAFSRSNQSLLISALTTLNYLAMTSVGTAREIARGLDIYLKDGTLHKLSTYTIAAKKKKKENTADINMDSEKENSKQRRIGLKVQSVFLDLTASLLQYDDPAILSYITNAGGKDSKLKAGALYHGLRAGLSQTKKFLDTNHKSATNSTEEFYQLNFFNVLRSMNKTLYKSDEKKENTDNSHNWTRRSLSNKAQLDLIKGSTLENLIEIGYASLKDTDDEEDSYLPDIKSECKEIVEILLCDVDISPLLKQINSLGGTDATVLAVLQQTGKAMQTLLTTSPTLDTRKFAVKCFHGAPRLFQYWLRTVSLPDIKPNYACLATFSLISFMLKNGPDLPASDLLKIQSSDKKKAFDIIVSFTAPRALTKNVLTKGIQSSNPLLVVETLKSLTIVLSRFGTIIEKNPSGEKRKYAAEKLLTKMPDLQVLLAVRSKFDPYTHDTSTQLARHHNFVVMNICEVLCLFANTLPMSFRTVQFEWIKLLSDSSVTFLSAPLSLQYRLLTTLLTINDCYNRVAPQSNSMSSTKAYHAFTSILLNTKNDTVYQLARQLVQMTISNVVNTSHIQDEKSDHHVDYEICLWLDGVTASTAVMFGKLLSAAQKVTIQHKTIVSNAWEAHFPNEAMPAITITSLLVLSLTALVSSEGNVPNDFIILIRDISTKILLKQSDRRMIAAILIYLSNAHHSRGTAPETLEDVFKFASAVLTELPEHVDKFELQAAERAFGEKHYHTTVAKLAGKEMMSGMDCKGLFGICANEVGCEIVCQSIRHLSKGDQARKICSYALPHCLFGGGNFGEHVADQILNSQSSPHSVLVCLLFTYFTSNHDQERQRFICDKIMNSLKKMVDEGSNERKARTTMHQVLLLVSGLLNDFTAESMGSITGTLSGICFDLAKDEIRRPYCALLLKTAKTSSSFKDYIGSLTSADVDSIFILWNSLSHAHHKGSPTDSIEVPLLLKLEELMATMLTNSEMYCLQAATVIKCIHKSGDDAVVDLAYKNLVHDELETKYGGPDQTRCGFLESLMIYDAFLFSSKIVERAVAKINSSGEFRLKDEIIAVGIREVLHQKQCHVQKWQGKASTIVIDRLCSILQHLIDDAVFHESTELIIDVVSRMWTLNELDINSKEKVYSQVTNLMLHWAKLKWREIPKSIESAILTFIYTIESCPVGHVENKAVVLLRNSTLSYMVKMLPKAIKVGEKQKNIYGLMISVTKKLVTVDQICSLECLQDILIVCLKFGIGSGVAQLSSKCLEISRILISNVYACDSTEKVIACFTPQQIHSMILTHSNFDTVAGQTSETRKELLSLLITCVSLANEPIDYNGEKLRALLMAFDASVSQEDLLFRRLLSLYEAGNDSDQERLFFLHDLVWGESNVSHSENLLIASDFGHIWENFIEKLDIKRIHKTINHFPLWDPVKPLPIQSIEPWAFKAEDNSIKEKIDNSDSEDESISSSSGSSREDSNTANPKLSNHDINIHQNTMYARDEDERYSPGFIMPMILGTLESFRELADNSDEEELSVVSDEEAHHRKRSFSDGKSKDEMKSNPAKESFAKVAYRLSQKGVLALCVACLSSKCPALRNTAVAVFYHFLQAIQSKEAQHIVEWKSRSQLDMAIRSVQRGLMVIRAKQILQRNEGDKRILLIPMLPNVSSLFLARSLFTLTKPADDLYSAINKSFLRLSDHHGAFTDCYSLPAFISLFCSANDSPDQARKERIWALNLLKDGTVDSYSYRMASRRHAPELLLTSFDALLAREDSIRDETECILLLETIEALIKQGGTSSLFHYFHVVGLPAWTQSLLHSIALDIDAKSPCVIMGFMQLISTVIDKIADESSTESESDRSRPPTALNAINIARNVTDIAASLHDDETEIVQHAYDILCSLRRIHDQHQPETCNNPQFHPHGLLVESCLQIIQSVNTLVACDPKMLIVAFCSFPFEEDCSKEGASRFALEALQAILPGCVSNNIMALNSRQCLSILRRLSALSSFVNDDDSYCAIIENLIGCRRILVTKHGLSSEWLSCVKSFVNDYGRSSQNPKKHSSYADLLNTFATITERD